MTTEFLNQCSEKYIVHFKEWPQHVSLFVSDRSNHDFVESQTFDILQTLSKIHLFFIELSHRRYSNGLDILAKQSLLLSTPDKLNEFIELNGWELILRLLPHVYKLCISIVSEVKSQRISVSAFSLSLHF